MSKEIYVSLTVGQSYRLPLDQPSQYSYASDNPLVVAATNGYIVAKKNALGTHSNSIVTVKSRLKGEETCVLKVCVTIVSWIANRSALVQQKHISESYRLLGCYEDAAYYYYNGEIRKTNDGFETSEYVSTIDFVPNQSPMMKTPCGFVLRSDNKLLRSWNLLDWEIVATFRYGGLYHSFDYRVTESGVVVYVCEYSVDIETEHSVYRVCLSNNGEAQSEKILTFAPHASRGKGLGHVHARHIHAVCVDPYSGDVWVATGDIDNQNMLLCSSDEGATFTFVGGGSQDWRALVVFFTENYIYWNTDTSSPQKIWRISREATLQRKRFDTIEGEYINAESLGLENGAVFGFEGAHRPEVVAELENGSLWYQVWAKDTNGEYVALLSGSPEGNRRDWMGRVFGIKEYADDQCEVQELLAKPPRSWNADSSKKRRARLDPVGQDKSGYVYFNGLFVEDKGLNRFLLQWNDSKKNRNKCEE